MAKKSSDTNNAFVNPFDKGVTYDQLFTELNADSIRDYCTGNGLTDAQVDWLEADFNIYLSNKKTS